MKRHFTAEEDNFIRLHCLFQSQSDIGDALGRSPGSIRMRIKILGLEVPGHMKEGFRRSNRSKRIINANGEQETVCTTYRLFSEEEDEFLKENYQNYSRKEMAHTLQRTFVDVCKRMDLLGIVLTPEFEEAVRDENRMLIPKESDGYVHKPFKSFEYYEDQYIIDNYLQVSVRAMGRHLNRGKSSVASRMEHLGLQVPEEVKRKVAADARLRKEGRKREYRPKLIRPFTPEDDQYLKENYIEIPLKDLHKKMQRNRTSVEHRLLYLGLELPRENIKKIKGFTAEEDKYIADNYLLMPAAQMDRVLGRTKDSCRVRMKRLGFVVPPDVLKTFIEAGRFKERPKKVKAPPQFVYKPYTPEEDEIIRTYYTTKSGAEISRMLGRPISSAGLRMKFLGLEVPSDKLKEFKSRGLFKPGNKPISTGKKIEEWMSPEGYERFKNRRFQPGNTPKNALKDGDIVIRVHTETGISYKFIRIAAANWMPYHRYVWEQTHGPLPDGHIVSFKNGDTMDCDICNLQLLTFKQNLERNKIDYPQEMVAMFFLQAAITREIKKLKKRLKKSDNGRNS